MLRLSQNTKKTSSPVKRVRAEDDSHGLTQQIREAQSDNTALELIMSSGILSKDIVDEVFAALISRGFVGSLEKLFQLGYTPNNLDILEALTYQHFLQSSRLVGQSILAIFEAKQLFKPLPVVEIDNPINIARKAIEQASQVDCTNKKIYFLFRVLDRVGAYENIGNLYAQLALLENHLEKMLKDQIDQMCSLKDLKQQLFYEEVLTNFYGDSLARFTCREFYSKSCLDRDVALEHADKKFTDFAYQIFNLATAYWNLLAEASQAGEKTVESLDKQEKLRLHYETLIKEIKRLLRHGRTWRGASQANGTALKSSFAPYIHEAEAAIQEEKQRIQEEHKNIERVIRLKKMPRPGS